MRKILVPFVILMLLCFLSPAFAQQTATNTTEAQSSASGGSVVVNFPESRDITRTTVDSKGSGYRGFPIGAQITYPMSPTYFNGATDGPSMTNLEDWLEYGNVFSSETLNTMANQSVWDFLGIGIKIITTPACSKVSEDKRPPEVRILMKGQVNGKYKRVATITVKATNLDTPGEKLAVAAAIEATLYGASEIHIIDFGKLRVISGYGWGIGLSYYAGSLSASEQSGQVGGGGTGYSEGESGYQDKPWIKVIAVIPAN